MTKGNIELRFFGFFKIYTGLELCNAYANWWWLRCNFLAKYSGPGIQLFGFHWQWHWLGIRIIGHQHWALLSNIFIDLSHRWIVNSDLTFDYFRRSAAASNPSDHRPLIIIRNRWLLAVIESRLPIAIDHSFIILMQTENLHKIDYRF